MGLYGWGLVAAWVASGAWSTPALAALGSIGFCLLVSYMPLARCSFELAGSGFERFPGLTNCRRTKPLHHCFAADAERLSPRVPPPRLGPHAPRAALLII